MRAWIVLSPIRIASRGLLAMEKPKGLANAKIKGHKKNKKDDIN